MELLYGGSQLVQVRRTGRLLTAQRATPPRWLCSRAKVILLLPLLHGALMGSILSISSSPSHPLRIRSALSFLSKLKRRSLLWLLAKVSGICFPSPLCSADMGSNHWRVHALSSVVGSRHPFSEVVSQWLLPLCSYHVTCFLKILLCVSCHSTILIIKSIGLLYLWCGKRRRGIYRSGTFQNLVRFIHVNSSAHNLS